MIIDFVPWNSLSRAYYYAMLDEHLRSGAIEVPIYDWDIAYSMGFLDGR